MEHNELFWVSDCCRTDFTDDGSTVWDYSQTSMETGKRRENASESRRQTSPTVWDEIHLGKHPLGYSGPSLNSHALSSLTAKDKQYQIASKSEPCNRMGWVTWSAWAQISLWCNILVLLGVLSSSSSCASLLIGPIEMKSRQPRMLSSWNCKQNRIGRANFNLV